MQELISISLPSMGMASIGSSREWCPSSIVLMKNDAGNLHPARLRTLHELNSLELAKVLHPCFLMLSGDNALLLLLY